MVLKVCIPIKKICFSYKSIENVTVCFFGFFAEGLRVFFKETASRIRPVGEVIAALKVLAAGKDAN